MRHVRIAGFRIVASAGLLAGLALAACTDAPDVPELLTSPNLLSGSGRPAILVNPKVRGNGTARTIQEGLAMVASGGKVMVLPGTYPEALWIDKGVTVEAVGGASGEVTIAPPAGPRAAIEVATGEPVVLRGLRVEHTGMLGILGCAAEDRQDPECAFAAVDLTVDRTAIVFLPGPRATAVPEIGLPGMAGLGIGTFTAAALHDGRRSRLVVTDSHLDLSAAPGPAAWGIFGGGDVDARIERSVVRGASFVCVELRLSPLLDSRVDALITANQLLDCGDAGALRVGGAQPPGATPVTATGNIDIIGNTIVRTDPAACVPGRAINFEVLTGRIEHNRIVDVIPDCATDGARALRGGIWVGSLVGYPDATPVIRFNDIAGNGHAGVHVSPFQTTVIDATCNWWGAADGPSGDGPGSGDAVIGAATFEPWASQPIAGAGASSC